MGSASYSSSDTFVAPAGVSSIDVEIKGGGGAGGGGGGGGAGGGGGGGGGCSVLTGYGVAPGGNYAVIVGGGGPSDGADGGASSFDNAGVSGGGGGGQAGVDGGAGGGGGGGLSGNGGAGLSGFDGGAGGQAGTTGGNGADGAGSGAAGDGGSTNQGSGVADPGVGGYVAISWSDPLPSPDTPTGLAATTGQVRHTPVSWDAAAGATGYKLYRDDDGYTTAIYDGAGTSYNDTPLGNNVAHSYKVTAYNDGGESAKSGSVSATTLALPTTPTGLAGTAGLISHIPLTWNTVAVATGYRLYRSTDSYVTPIYDGASASYNDISLADNTTYSYKVLSYNDAGVSAKSAAVDVLTGTAAARNYPGFERPDCLSFVPLQLLLELF